MNIYTTQFSKKYFYGVDFERLDQVKVNIFSNGKKEKMLIEFSVEFLNSWYKKGQEKLLFVHCLAKFVTFRQKIRQDWLEPL